MLLKITNTIKTGATNLSILIFWGLTFASCGTNRGLVSTKDADKPRPILLIPDTSLFQPNEMFLDPVHKFEFTSTKSEGLETEDISVDDTAIIRIYSNSPIFLNPHVGSFEKYMVFPGEHVFIKMEKDGSLSYSVSGNDRRTKELNCSKILFNKIYEINRKALSKYYVANVFHPTDVREVENEIERQSGILSVYKHNFLDSISALYSLGEESKANFVQYIQADSLLRRYTFYNEFKKCFIDQNLWEQTYRQLIQDLELLSNQTTFNFYLDDVDYLFSLIKSFKAIKSVIRETDDFIQQYKAIEDNFKGLAREYLLSKIMSEALARRIPLGNYIEKYKTAGINPAYREIIKGKIQEYKKLTSHKYTKLKDGLFCFGATKKTTIKKIVEREKGKLVLVDVWASWCMPCREEMPFSRKLKDKYAGRDISFIYLSLDRRIDYWTKASISEELDSRNSFVFVDFQKSDFLSKYKVEEIPRYVLIGKDGEIIEEDAPSPDDPALEMLIDKYLEE